MRYIFFIIAIFLYGFSYGELKFYKTILSDEIPSGKEFYEFCFKFKNEGASSVKIESLNSTCSCTIPSLEKKVYKSGESGEIKGVFYVYGKQGLQEQEIVVGTDDISQSKIRLQLKIKILNEYEISSRLVYWRLDSEEVEKTVILSLMHSDWKFDGAVCSENKFSVNVAENGGKYLIKVKPLRTNEAMRDLISIKLKSKDGEIKTIALHALVK